MERILRRENTVYDVQDIARRNAVLTKYFKPGQKIQIHPKASGDSTEKLESLTAYVAVCGNDYLDLALPYQTRAGEEYPFAPKMELELLSHSFGLGVRAWGRFESFRGNDLIRVHCRMQLEAFQRRVLPRIDIPVGLRYARGQGNLRTLREKWESKLSLLQQSQQPKKPQDFPYCPVNLSGGGIRFTFRDDVEVADLCLLLMELEPEKPPVCVLAEVVWMRPAEEPGWKTAGMQFNHIRKSDYDQICRFVNQTQHRQIQEMGGSAAH